MKANTKNAYAVGMRWSSYDDAKAKDSKPDGGVRAGRCGAESTNNATSTRDPGSTAPSLVASRSGASGAAAGEETSLSELHRLSYSVSEGRRCPVAEAVRRACLGVSLREAVADISVSYGLTDAEAEWVETQADDELASLQMRGRLAHV